MSRIYKSSTTELTDRREDLLDAIEQQDEEDLIQARHRQDDEDESEYEDDYDHVSDTDENVTCCRLCAEEATQGFLVNECGHMACKICMTKLLGHTCPFCRAKITQLTKVIPDVVQTTRKQYQHQEKVLSKQSRNQHQDLAAVFEAEQNQRDAQMFADTDNDNSNDLLNVFYTRRHDLSIQDQVRLIDERNARREEHRDRQDREPQVTGRAETQSTSQNDTQSFTRLLSLSRSRQRPVQGSQTQQNRERNFSQVSQQDTTQGTHSTRPVVVTTTQNRSLSLSRPRAHSSQQNSSASQSLHSSIGHNQQRSGMTTSATTGRQQTTMTATHIAQGENNIFTAGYI